MSPATRLALDGSHEINWLPQKMCGLSLEINEQTHPAAKIFDKIQKRIDREITKIKLS